MISGGYLGDIRGINEGIHVSGIWEIYNVISAWVVQPRGRGFSVTSGVFCVSRKSFDSDKSGDPSKYVNST